VDTRPLLIKSDSDRMNLWLEGPNLKTLGTNHTDIFSTHISVHEVKVLSHNSQVDKDHTAFTPASLFTRAFHPHSPIGTSHDTDYLHRDNRIESAISPRFWYRWDEFYLPLLQKRKKCFKTTDNIREGQLVLVGGHGEFVKRGEFRVGRISKVFPQIRHGKTFVRRASVAVLSTNEEADDSKLTFVERHISKLAPLELTE